MSLFRFFKPSDIKDAQVHWVGSFWRTNQGKWNVNVYLLSTDKIIQTYLPVGAMPFLAVGAKVTDGYLLGSDASEEIEQTTITDFSAGKFVKLSEMPKSLRSYYGNSFLSNELVYLICLKGNKYYIPQTEIIRSLLAVNSTLSNRMLNPEGLSMLISKYEIDDDKVTVELAKEYPTKLLTHASIIHLMCLFLKGELRNLWSSVYSHAVSGVRDRQMFDQVPLKGLNVSFKYEQLYNSYLVKEIREVNGIKPPFNSIAYSHPDVKEHTGDKVTEYRRLPKGEKDNSELDNTTEPSADNNRDVAWHDSIFVKMKFRGVKAEHAIEKVDAPKKQIKNVNTQESTIHYTLRDYVGNGKGKPIELQNLSALPDDVDVYGLEKFIAAITAMERSGYVRVHKVIIESLEGETAFVSIGSRKRSCAIVFVDNSVIIEFGRPDDYPISTLIVRKINQNSIHDNIKRLVASAIENNGHWDRAFLDVFHSISYQFAKHSKIDNNVRWAMRLMNKLR